MESDTRTTAGFGLKIEIWTSHHIIQCIGQKNLLL